MEGECYAATIYVMVRRPSIHHECWHRPDTALSRYSISNPILQVEIFQRALRCHVTEPDGLTPDEIKVESHRWAYQASRKVFEWESDEQKLVLVSKINRDGQSRAWGLNAIELMIVAVKAISSRALLHQYSVLILTQLASSNKFLRKPRGSSGFYKPISVWSRFHISAFVPTRGK